MKKFWLYIIVLMLTACEKQVDWPLQADDTSKVVIDGMITNEIKSHSVRLFRTVSHINMAPQAISGAAVIISDADSSWFLAEDIANPGVYRTKNNFFARPGQKYSLLVSADGTVYTAKTQMVPNTSFTSLHYAKNSGDHLYRITWVANAYNAAHPAMYEILLDWSHLPAYSSLDSASCTARLFYYSLPTIDVSQVFAPEMEKVNFPRGTKIIEKKYSLNSEYAEFIRALISETNWKGGLFDSAPANVPTNLSAGAIGFFAACNVIADTIVVQ
mgnify:CR=1 FL=1